MSLQQQLIWTLGLKNKAAGKYLTQETFGFKLNVNGSSLKKKQRFTLISADGGVYLKTHMDRYLYGDKDGNFKGDLEDPTPEALWQIHRQADGTWALQSSHGYFLEGTGDALRCFAKEVPSDGLYVIQLAMHPQLNLKNVMRKRFVHFVPQDKQLQCNEDLPWGDDALVTLIFFGDHPSGRYGLKASNGQYLSKDGKLVNDASPDCQFLLGFHDNLISFTTEDGDFLSTVGGKGVLKAIQKPKITRDEMFEMQDSQPQFILTDGRGRYVSNRSSNEVKADQKDVTDLERFQFNVQNDGSIQVLNSKARFWEMAEDSVVFAENKEASKSGLSNFKIEWCGNRIKIAGPNGQFITVASNGALKANGSNEEGELFTPTLINRPELVLRGPYGYVGVKGASGRVEVNRGTYDVFKLESDDGNYFLKAEGKYWTVTPDGIEATGSQPQPFHLEFPQLSMVLIKHPDSGRYLQGEQNGGFKAVGGGASANTLWEF